MTDKIISDEEFVNKVHMLIHSLRLISNYKSSEAEKKLSILVLEKFGDSCAECKEIKERNKYMQLAAQYQQPQKEGLFDKLFGGFK